MEVKKWLFSFLRLISFLFVIVGLVIWSGMDGFSLLVVITAIGSASFADLTIIKTVVSPGEVSFLRAIIAIFIIGGFLGVFHFAGLGFLLAVGFVAWGFPKFFNWTDLVP